jgi:hypothetical protein
MIAREFKNNDNIMSFETMAKIRIRSQNGEKVYIGNN